MVPEISLESLLEINTIRTALEEMAVVAAAGKITPDREQTLNALLDEFQQALESGVMEKILWPTALSALRSTTTRICQRCMP